MNRLIMMGNGFDLAHGLRTRYGDFIASAAHFAELYGEFKKGDDNWNEVESKYKELVVEKLEVNREEIDVGEFVESVLDTHGTGDDGEVNYWDYRPDTFKQEIAAVSPVVHSLVSFEAEFLRYLRRKYSDKQIQELCLPIKALQSLFAGATMAISFNYTNVPELIYGCSIVEHIHGNINEKIVIGCDTFDRLDETRVLGSYPAGPYSGRPKDILIEQQRYYEYDMKGGLVERAPIKRFYDDARSRNQRNEEELYALLKMKSKDYLGERNDIIRSLTEEHYDEVHILGHSLGEADWSIFSALNADKIICYYHDKKDYENKKRIILRNGWDIVLLSDCTVFESDPVCV